MPDNIKQIFRVGNEETRFKMYNKLLENDTYYTCDLEINDEKRLSCKIISKR